MILCLQYYNGDKEQAMALARLIADMEPSKKNEFTFVFAARLDTEHDE